MTLFQVAYLLLMRYTNANVYWVPISHGELFAKVIQAQIVILLLGEYDLNEVCFFYVCLKCHPHRDTPWSRLVRLGELVSPS